MCQRIGRLLKSSLFILPIVTCIWTVLGFIIPYGVAVSYNHTYAVFPYISNTGILVPERGIFTLFVSVAALLMTMNAVMRFQYIKLCLAKNRQSVQDTDPESFNKGLYRRLSNINKTGLFLNILASIGLLMVASFQVKIMDAPHYFGAFLTFVLGAACCWIQTYLTWKKEDRSITTTPKLQRKTFICQLVTSIVISIIFVIFSSAIAVYRLRKKAGHGTKRDVLRGVFLLSSFSEWFLAIFIVAFFLTFVPGFRRMEFIGMNVNFKRHEKYARAI